MTPPRKQTLYFYRRQDDLAGLEGELLNTNPVRQLDRFERGEITNLFASPSCVTGWHTVRASDRIAVVFLGTGWSTEEYAQGRARILDPYETAVEVPMRKVPDWQAVGDTVERCGAMRLGMDVTPELANSAHASLHRRGMGVYQLQENGVQIGWIVEPRNRRKTC